MPTHRVRFEPQGRTVSVPADETVLDAALAAGLNLPHSCKSGHCGSCRARLLAGSVHYPAGRPLGLMAAEEAAGFALLCRARAVGDLVVEARVIRSVTDVEIKTLPCRIDAREPLAPDVLRLMLRLPAVENFRFLPGQYLDVLADGGRRRSFSIASPPHDAARLELHVRHVPGGTFTGGLFAQQAAGALLRIEGPIGQFVYTDDASPAIFIAGGTGFAPIKAMLEHAFAEHTDRELVLYWGVRALKDLYMAELPQRWQAERPNFTFIPVLSDPAPADAWQGRTGFVHEAVLADFADLSGYQVYACGAPVMVDNAREAFTRTRGLPEDEFFADSFVYAADAETAPAT